MTLCALYVHRLVCGVRLATLDAGDNSVPRLNNRTLAVAIDRLLCASPCVCSWETNKQTIGTPHISHCVPQFHSRVSTQPPNAGGAAAPTLIAEWGTTSVARLAAPLGEWMDHTQCSTWVATAPPRQLPLVCRLTIAFNMYVHRLVYAVGKQPNKQLEHPTFHIVYRNSTPGFPHSHQTLVVTRFTLRSHSLLSGAALA